MKTAILLGASGLVGGYVLEFLLNDDTYEKVIVLSRKNSNQPHPKKQELIINFDQLEQHKNELKADVVFCCLGTTISKAGSKEAFKKVDYEYPLKVAEIAKQNGAKSYLLISALGASKSSIVFYNQVKGEVENAIQQLQFDAFHILQPSLIIGERKEARFTEGIAQKISPILDGVLVGYLSKYKSIKAEQIAKAMVHYSKQNKQGTFKHDSKDLQQV